MGTLVSASGAGVVGYPKVPGYLLGTWVPNKLPLNEAILEWSVNEYRLQLGRKGRYVLRCLVRAMSSASAVAV